MDYYKGYIHAVEAGQKKIVKNILAGSPIHAFSKLEGMTKQLQKVGYVPSCQTIRLNVKKIS